MADVQSSSKPEVPVRRTSSEKKDSAPGKEGSADGQAELATAIDELLDTVGSKFKTMSKDIMAQSELLTPDT